MANTAGTVSALYKYGAYGEPLDVNGNLNWAGPAFRYTGQTVLEGAGLYHYKARIYDPLMGRFLQTDPIGSKDDINLYAYTGGDPINATDITGLDAGKIIDIFQAFGAGHSGSWVSDGKGNVSLTSYTGEGKLENTRDITGSDTIKVDVDKNGNVTDNGLETIAQAFMNHWSKMGDGAGQNVAMTVYRGEYDKVAYDKEVSSLRAHGAREGGPDRKGMWGGFIRISPPGDATYGLVNYNCDHVANQLLNKAGVYTPSQIFSTISPNPALMAPNVGHAFDSVFIHSRRYSNK
jgi:RHS repeat-associated protein